jgi:hypothetical protein
LPYLAPQHDAARLKPVVQRCQIGEGGLRDPEPVTSVLDILLDLPLLPARGWIAELGIEQIVAGHGREACIDLPRLAGAHAVHGVLHIVVNAAPRHAAQHPEGMLMRIEQHLMGLQRIGAHDKSAAVRQLEVRNLQLCPLPAQHCPVLAPVELECVIRLKDQKHEDAPASGLQRALAIGNPLASKRSYTPIGTLVAESNEVGM